MKTDEVFVFFPEATTHPTTQKRGCMPRIRRTFGKKTRKFDEQTFENDFRYPPKPDSYYDVKEKGQCRWCDGIINDEYGRRNMRATWHPDCSEEYLMYYNSKHIRKYIKQRDYCECAECGDYDPRFQIDHIRPLYEQKYKQPDEVDWSYWDEKNLQTLCRKCHKKKTKGDMERLREFNEGI